jgi:hypothetical protein
MKTRRRPGQVRDAIQAFLTGRPNGGSVREIQRGVDDRLGKVPASSVRSSLQLSDLFERLSRGQYRLVGK